MFDGGMSEGTAFESWLASELRQPVRDEPGRVERVMARVRSMPCPRRRILRDGATSPLLAFSLAATLVLAAVLPPLAGGRMGTVQQVVRDTTHLVRFALVAPGAARVTVVGDFNAWEPEATPLARADDSTWTASLALNVGRHRYAFVVDDTQWVADPRAPRDSASRWSVRAVPDTTI